MRKLYTSPVQKLKCGNCSWKKQAINRAVWSIINELYIGCFSPYGSTRFHLNLCLLTQCFWREHWIYTGTFCLTVHAMKHFSPGRPDLSLAWAAISLNGTEWNGLYLMKTWCHLFTWGKEKQSESLWQSWAYICRSHARMEPSSIWIKIWLETESTPIPACALI